MRLTTRRDRMAALVVATVVVLPSACDASFRQSCASAATVINVEPTRSTTLDIDCDGVADTIRLATPREGLQQLTVSGSLDAELRLSASADLVGAADFNRDGLLDLVFRTLDESSASADIVLINRDSLRFAPYADGLRQAATVLFHDVGLAGQCAGNVVPRIVRASDGGAVLAVAAGDVATPADCEELVRVELTVLRDTLQRVR